MKKVLFCICYLLAFSLSLAFAEGKISVDFNNLNAISDTELLFADELLETEKAHRGLSIVLSDGNYLVGRDIAPGYYKIKYFAFEEGYSFDLHMRVYVSEEKKDEYERAKSYEVDWRDYTKFWESYHKTGELQIRLDEGQVLYVKGSQVKGATYIEKASALFMD